jgi:hypothetical protein
VARLRLARRTRDTDSVADLESALRPGKDELLVFRRAVHKIDAQVEIESLGIIEQFQQDVGYVAAIFPVADSPGGHGAARPVRSSDEVRAAEEVYEKISCHPGQSKLRSTISALSCAYDQLVKGVFGQAKSVPTDDSPADGELEEIRPVTRCFDI